MTTVTLHIVTQIISIKDDRQHQLM